MNQIPQSIGLYSGSQGTPFVQVPQQQPISRLSNPTTYHLEQTQKRKNQISSDGAPPTPNNSYQNSNNSFIEPGAILLTRQQQQQQQQFQYINPIKQETSSEFIEDFDPSNTVMSPMAHSNSSGGSFGSPPGRHMYDTTADDFGKSFKPPSHLDNFASLEAPPYSPVDNLDFYEFSPMSAPANSAISPMDVKSNMNSSSAKVRFATHPPSNFNQISASLPVHLTNPGDGWQSFGTSLDAHPSSLQFSNTGDISGMSSSFMEDEVDPKTAAAHEKRRRRRESHNAVERRRRDNINEKIQELSTLLPDLFVDTANKPNKGVILRKSVDYIRFLKHQFEQERNRNEQLETQVRELSSKSGIPIENNSGSASRKSDLNNSFGSPHSSSLGNMP